MTCNASIRGGRRRSRSAKRSRSVRRGRGRMGGYEALRGQAFLGGKRSRSRGRGRMGGQGLPGRYSPSANGAMQGGAVATNATALALTQGSTSGTDYVGKLMGGMGTQWENVFEPTSNLASYNGNQYVLRNGDSIPTIPTSMTGGQRGKKRRKNITKRPHQQDWSSLSPLSHLSSSPLPPNITDNRKMRRGKKTGGGINFGFWGP